MYAIRKSPILVIEVVGNDDINNYPENIYRKEATVPGGVLDKHLKWDNGDPETGTLVEMSLSEQLAVDAGDLDTAKATKKTAMKVTGRAWVFGDYATAEEAMDAQRDAALEVLQQTEVDSIVAKINAARSHYKNDLVPAINNASSITQLDAIVWNPPA